MRYFKIFLMLLIGLIGVLQAKDIYYCNAMCKTEIDEFSGIGQDLNCTLPAMPTFKVHIPNVMDSEGKLRYYWSGQTACDVLGWVDDAVRALPKMKEMHVDASDLGDEIN